MKLRLFVSFILIAAISSVIGSIITRHFFFPNFQKAELIQRLTPKPLEIYSLDNLIKTSVPKGQIIIKEKISEDTKFTSYLFIHEFDPKLRNSTSKKVSGQINIPKGDGPFPVIIQFRGYVDQSIYQTGIGTRKSAQKYTEESFITVAPDFLGYGESDSNATDVLESRFQAYTTALSIVASAESLPQWDKRNLFLWGHSNGGLIALTILEITSLPIPTVLWAPVSKPFPYSVLYYTDESADRGKLLRNEIAKFEQLYDAEKYSFDNYLDRITAPVQLHQGTADSAVPLAWSNDLVKKLKNVKYFTYRGADHNLTPGWDNVVARDIEFFKKNLK